ncbi:3-oxoadipate enol-lactonase (plasmid) [Acidovorax sp. DW039]|uniref:3-oxoadipate enol-lactonase n=1 Tax=Acidovorax sp. DW039 TaxID=3095606 RepID=UPI0030899AE2|nr:3-oxoadipate enol-lactonase [Acidovorax sp. DW039]
MTAKTSSLATDRGMFRIAIEGPEHAPALMLSNSLGTTLEMWEPQVAALTQHWRVVRYDTRGHGDSLVTPGPYSFDVLGMDALAVLDTLGIQKAAFCGISMGGHTGLWLGIHAGHRLQALVVCNSAARIGSASAWAERASMVRANGTDSMQSLAASAPARWFTPGFTQRQPLVVQRAQAWIASTPPEGYAACCDALGHSDLRDQLARITAPTLLLAGSADPVTTVAEAQSMQACIPGAQLAVVPASHLSNLEAPHAFTGALLDFLAAATA